MQARVGAIRCRRRSSRTPLAIITPKPSPSTAKRCQSLVPARCSRKGSSTSVVPQTDRPTTIQIARLPAAVEGRGEKSARSRSQIIGKARKAGAPARKCHQLPWLPGTRSVTASHGDVSNANGKKATAPAANQTTSNAAFAHAGPCLSSGHTTPSPCAKLTCFSTVTPNPATQKGTISFCGPGFANQLGLRKLANLLLCSRHFPATARPRRADAR